MTTPDDTTGKRENDMPQDVLDAAQAALDRYGHLYGGMEIMARALLAERERCARVIETHRPDASFDDSSAGKRPKPIELVARAAWPAYFSGIPGFDTPENRAVAMARAEAAFSILTKHGCISIEGIIARDEEMGE